MSEVISARGKPQNNRENNPENNPENKHKDTLFTTPYGKMRSEEIGGSLEKARSETHLEDPTGFRFDERTAMVFDDMIERSVPGYRQTIAMMVELVSKRYVDSQTSAQENTSPIEKNRKDKRTQRAIHPAQPTPKKMRFLDLGCSTGTTLRALRTRLLALEEQVAQSSSAKTSRLASSVGDPSNNPPKNPSNNPSSSSINNAASHRANSHASPLDSRVRMAHYSFTGVDSSPAMIEKAKESNAEIDWQVDEATYFLERHYHALASEKNDASGSHLPWDVIFINYTLQFIPPSKRNFLLQMVWKVLKPGGWLFLSEKTIETDPVMHALFEEQYHLTKRNNRYSEIEIARKKQALENVLIAEPLDTHLARLVAVGFKRYTIIRRQYNFCTFLAIK